MTLANNDFQVRIELSRKPAEDEWEHTNRIFRSATAEYRGRLASPR